MRSLIQVSEHLYKSTTIATQCRAYSSSIAGSRSQDENSTSRPISLPHISYVDFQHDSYKLRPLTKGTCTRVLTIQPSADKAAPVSFDVEEIDLSGTYNPFVTISHVWGSNPVYDKLTICGDQPRYVTRRVDSLLHRIRNKISENESYKHWNRIWIDTLCIDQADNVLARREKNHQVSIMHKIFGDAQEVVVDLGAADRYSYLLPSAKQEIIHLQQKAHDDEYCKDILGFPSSVKVDPKEAERVRKALEACSRLLDKQWMCRIWTVQEFALARKCTFLSGQVVIDGGLLKELGKLAAHANLKGRSHLSMLFSRFRRALALSKLPQLSVMQDQDVLTMQKLGFGESLALGWHHDCSDERDTVYALRALVDYRGEPLRVDYNEPSNMLARRVSRKLIELGDYEAVLAGARGLTKTSEGGYEPSWSFLMRPTFKFVGEERHWILSGKPNKFMAGGRSVGKTPTLRMASEDCMEVEISQIGILAAVGEKFPSIPQYGSNPTLPIERLYAYNTERAVHTRAVITHSWLRHTLSHLNQSRKNLKYLGRRSHEVWTTITHGYNGIGSNTQHLADLPSTQDQIDHWLMLIDMSLRGLEDLGYQYRNQSSLSNDIKALDAAMRRRHSLLAELGRKPQVWVEDLQHKFDLLGNPLRQGGTHKLAAKTRALIQSFSHGAGGATVLSQHEQMLRKVALNTYMVNEAFDIRQVRAMDQLKMLERRLGVLEDGRFVSAPALAEVGDVLVVFRGISVPYVLSKQDGEFKIVGMGYMNGMMHGEAVDESTEWRTIQIT